MKHNLSLFTLIVWCNGKFVGIAVVVRSTYYCYYYILLLLLSSFISIGIIILTCSRRFVDNQSKMIFHVGGFSNSQG